MSAHGRRLGARELFFDLIHPTRDLICVHTWHLTSKKAIASEELQRTVSLWTLPHPLLRVCIETRPDGKYYVPMEIDMSPELVCCLPEVPDWIRLVESELTRPLDTSKGPLWRAHFGSAEPFRSENGSWRYILVLTFHHCITDGLNLFTIICELLDLLNGRSVPKEAIFELPPCCEQLLCEGRFAYEGPPPELDQKWVARGRKIPASFGDKLIANGSCRILPFSFSSQVTDCLVRLSKKHQVKMNATLCTVASIAMAQLLEENGECLPATVQFYLPVNLRRSLGVHLEQMGCYTTGFACRTELRPSIAESKEQFWQLAKKQNDELHARLERGEALEAAKKFSLFLKKFESEHQRSSNFSFTVTNIGSVGYAVQHGSGATIGVDAVYRVAACAEERPITHATNTVNGRLFWNLAFNDKAVRGEMATRYKQLIEELIAAIARGQ